MTDLAPCSNCGDAMVGDSGRCPRCGALGLPEIDALLTEIALRRLKTTYEVLLLIASADNLRQSLAGQMRLAAGSVLAGIDQIEDAVDEELQYA